MPKPKTLQAAILYFSDFDNCQRYMIEIRWPDGKVRCPSCGSDKVTYLQNQRRWKCYEKHSRPQFSLKVGTIMEDSAIGMDKWFCTMWMIANCKNGVSSYEVARDLGVTQKTAWFMLHRIREGMGVYGRSAALRKSAGLRPRIHRSHRDLCSGPCACERRRELLVAAEAVVGGDLCFRRAVPSSSIRE